MSFNHSSTYRIGSPPPLKVYKTALKYSLQGKNFKDAMSVKQTSLNKKLFPFKAPPSIPAKHKNQAIANEYPPHTSKYEVS